MNVNRKTKSKRLLSLLLVLCMVATLLPVMSMTAFAASSGTWKNITWTLDTDGTLTLSGSGDMVDFTPYPWREERENIKKVVIEEGITSISYHAFGDGPWWYACTALEEVTIPSTVTKIEEAAFIGCNNLKKVNVKWQNIEKIGDFAFYGCPDLEVPVLNFSNKLDYLGKEAFKRCSGIENVNLGPAVGYLGDAIFAECSNLKSVVLPDYNYDIPLRMFQNCYNLSEINVPKHLKKVGMYAFSGCRNLPGDSIQEMLNTATTFGDEAFMGCEKLYSVTIPSSINEISWALFSDCTELRRVIIPDNITSISDWAFNNCVSLTSIVLPDSELWIGRGAFEGCSRLTSVFFKGNAPEEMYGSTDQKKASFETDIVTLYYIKGKTGWPETPGPKTYKGYNTAYWDGNPSKITNVDITGVTEPVAGARPSYDYQLSTTPANSAVKKMDWGISGIKWYKYDGYLKEMKPTDTFEEGGIYQVYFGVTPINELYYFDNENNGVTNYYFGRATINGKGAPFKPAVANREEKWLSVRNQYTVKSAPTITTSSLPDGTDGTLYNQTITATGDTPIIWEIESGSLPDGLELNDDVISGTPTEVGTSTFTVKATNSAGSVSKTLSITINAGSPTITTNYSLPNGNIGEEYNQTLEATGTAPINWSIESGSLPAGLTLDPNTGVISGTPTASGSSTFTVKATNSAGSDSKELNITVNIRIINNAAATVTTPVAGANPDLAPISGNSSAYDVEVDYWYLNEAPYTHLAAGDAFEGGKNYNLRLKFTAKNGYSFLGTTEFTINGKPTKDYHTTIKAYREITFSVPATATPLTGTLRITGDAEYNGQLKAKFDGTLPGKSTYQWRRGSTEIGENSIFYVATEEDIGNVITCEVTSDTVPGVVVSNAVTIEKRHQISPTVKVVNPTEEGEKGKIEWTDETMEYASDLSFGDAKDCSNPETIVEPGTYYIRFKETKTHKVGESTKVTIKAPRVLNNLPVKVFVPTEGAYPTNLSYKPQYTEYYSNEIEWREVNGGIEGKKLDQTTDTFEVGKTYRFRLTLRADSNSIIGKDAALTLNGSAVHIEDRGNKYIKFYYDFTVPTATGIDVPLIVTDSLPNGTVGTTYSQNIYAVSDEEITWTLAEGTLPAGLTLNASTGKIDGIPETAGTANFKVKATSSAGDCTQSLSITIINPAPPTTEITAANIPVTAPKTGDAPSSATTTATAYTVASTSWDPTDNPFKADTAYTVTINLEVAGPNKFTENTKFYINGNKATLVSPNPITGNVDSVRVSYTFPKTEADPGGGMTTTYTVTFDANGGTCGTATATTGADGKLASLPTATRSGSYSFKGWYTEASGGTKITTGHVFSADTTVYAQWTYTGGGGGSVTTKYTLTFNTNGGSKIDSISKTRGTTVNLASYKPTKDGYTFDGWYSDKKLTEKVTSVKLNKDTTVYAKWETKNPATGAGLPFIDVKSGDWFYDDVAYVFENGLMIGTSSTTFSPLMTTTRGMIVTVLYRQAGSPTVSGNCPFDDVKSGRYYEAPIAWAAANGIVKGYSADKFGPDDPITREQMAAILYRYAQHKGIDVSAKADLSQYNDAAKVSDWAKDAIAWTVKEGIFNGVGDGLLSPETQATRAQIAAILHRFCENIAK